MMIELLEDKLKKYKKTKKQIQRELTYCLNQDENDRYYSSGLLSAIEEIISDLKQLKKLGV